MYERSVQSRLKPRSYTDDEIDKALQKQIADLLSGTKYVGSE